MTSLIFLGTLKNYDIAGGMFLALLSKKAALPATLFTTLMMSILADLISKRAGHLRSRQADIRIFPQQVEGIRYISCQYQKKN